MDQMIEYNINNKQIHVKYMNDWLENHFLSYHAKCKSLFKRIIKTEKNQVVSIIHFLSANLNMGLNMIYLILLIIVELLYPSLKM